MDGLVTAAEGTGRRGGLVRLVAGGAAACTGSELLGAEGCKTNGFDNFDKIAFWKTPQAQGGKFVPYSRWTQDYIAIMGGR